MNRLDVLFATVHDFTYACTDNIPEVGTRRTACSVLYSTMLGHSLNISKKLVEKILGININVRHLKLKPIMLLGVVYTYYCTCTVQICTVMCQLKRKCYKEREEEGRKEGRKEETTNE